MPLSSAISPYFSPYSSGRCQTWTDKRQRHNRRKIWIFKCFMLCPEAVGSETEEIEIANRFEVFIRERKMRKIKNRYRIAVASVIGTSGRVL